MCSVVAVVVSLQVARGLQPMAHTFDAIVNWRSYD
jgi:hypothetical protein